VNLRAVRIVIVVVVRNSWRFLVHTRGPVGRFLLAVGLVLAGLVLVVGGLALPPAGRVAAVVAGGVAAALAAGVVRESPDRPGRRSVAEVAWQSAAGTVGAVLLIAGIAALAGGVVAALVTGAAVIAAAVILARRAITRTAGAPGSRASAPQAAASAVPPAWPRPTAAARALPPVSGLPTWALGREWQRTTTALAVRMPPAVRESIVRRRQETLDELERRDPSGFARWLAAGPVPGSDPAQYVRGDARRLGDHAAGTDAA
jgi:hypothetical protein